MGVFSHLARKAAPKLAVLAALVPAPAVMAGQHPSLVDPATTKCQTCHAELLRGRVVHAPVAEDCLSCHDFSQKDGRTEVRLSAAPPQLCVTCHDDLEKSAAGDVKSPHPPVAESCLNCHKPHSSDQPHLLAEAPQALCLTCHDLSDLEKPHGGQLVEGVDCTSCHSPHGSSNPHMLKGSKLHPPFAEGSCDSCHREPFAGRVRLAARGDRLCQACHGDIAESPGPSGSVHPALEGARGRAGCLSCHDPHMSDNAKMLVAQGPDLCAKCHASTVAAARAKTGHPPAGEDCLNCHQPHTSPQAHLLSEAPPGLCRTCHDPEDADLKKAHLGADPAKLDCTTCHSPHGAGQRWSLAATVHPPVLDSCDTCHEGAWNKLVENGDSALCLSCHDDIGTASDTAKVKHPAMEMARCVDCHNPHASAQTGLVKDADGRECTACHDDKAAGPEETQHGAIAAIGCRACHEPHGGDKPNLLRKVGNELCLGCHDPRQVKIDGDKPVTLLGRFEVPAAVARAATVLRLSADGTHGHPTQRHRVSGTPTPEESKGIATSFTGELSCLTCHDPHKGRSRELFRWGVASTTQACSHCHAK